MPEFKGEWGGEWSYNPRKQVGKKGGFGAVYFGTDTDGSPVAVKIIKRDRLGGGDLPERLLRREVEIATKLRDRPFEYLVTVLDVASRGGDVLVVMELAEKSLAEFLREGSVSESDAVAILREVTSGLHELHQIGVIHRDLKPDNVLRAGDRWKLSDFGIAHDQAVGTQTYTFQGWGTWAYMAPELFEPRSPTVKSDLYALGCLAFEILSGSPPFPGPDLESYRRQHGQEAPPALLVENTSLRDMVLRLLNKNPAERHQDARAVLERLERIAAPLSHAQTELARLAAQHANERSTKAAKLAGEAAERKRREDLQAQARSDFEELINEGLEEVRRVLPEAKLTGGHGQFAISGPDALLAIQLWASDLRHSPQDRLVVAGEIIGSNRRQASVLLANCVAETEEGQVVWNLYRVRMNAIFGGDYRIGPRDRSHGLGEGEFREHRQHMIGGGTHIFSTKRQRLVANTFVELFSEAMALPEQI
jgi:hypothetical protein